MSIPPMNPTPKVCTKIPEGGDQDPSGSLAIRTPLPPAPETQSPVRMTVKIARPTQFLMTFCGILTKTLGGCFGPLGAFGSVAMAGCSL